jgi:hypothetical protein
MAEASDPPEIERGIIITVIRIQSVLKIDRTVPRLRFFAVSV